MKLRDNAVRLGLFLACALLLSGCSNGEAASELTLQDQVEIIEAHEQLRNDLIALLNVERAADEQITSDDSLDSVAEFAAGVVLANPGAYPVTDGLSEPLTNLLAGTTEEKTPAPTGKQRAADPAEEDADEAETPGTQPDEPEKAIVKSYETGFVRAAELPVREQQPLVAAHRYRVAHGLQSRGRPHSYRRYLNLARGARLLDAHSGLDGVKVERVKLRLDSVAYHRAGLFVDLDCVDRRHLLYKYGNPQNSFLPAEISNRIASRLSGAAFTRCRKE